MSVVPYVGSKVGFRDPGISNSSLMSLGNLSSRSRSLTRLKPSNYFNSDFRRFPTDIFRATHGMFSQMDRMMSSMMRDPFGNDPFFTGSPLPSLMGDRSALALSPFGGSFNNILSAGENMSREGNCHSFSSSSVMTMSTGPDGNPQAPLVMRAVEAKSCRWQESYSRGLQVYQATSSSRAVPGGARETKNTVSDSRTGVRKMAIGHHIKDRSHVVEKEMQQNGDLEERQEFINLEEDDANNFDGEFRRLTQQAYGGGPLALDSHTRQHRTTPGPSHHRSTYMPALPSSSYRRRTRPLLALTSGNRSEERQRNRERGGSRYKKHH